MAKLIVPKMLNEAYGPGHEEYHFECPGCQSMHRYIVRWGEKSRQKEPVWSFNGDLDRPTFRASLLYNQGGLNPNQPVCHLYMTDGKIQFLADCTHELAGQTVDMPEVING